MTRNLKGKGGLPDLKTYRYSFRLNEQQNAEFLKLQAQAGIGQPVEIHSLPAVRMTA